MSGFAGPNILPLVLLSRANDTLAPGERNVLLTKATTKQGGPCQVRSKTEHPCPHRAVMEIRGIPFCEACARQQEVYFAIGELTQEAK
jgi:hypothetical protein